MNIIIVAEGAIDKHGKPITSEDIKTVSDKRAYVILLLFCLALRSLTGRQKVPFNLALKGQGAIVRRRIKPSILSSTVVLNLCYSGVFELQFPETPASRVDGEGFWELQSKNI